MGYNKGGAFEREICKRLSLWWTDNERDDVYWRTSNSGGRATVRGRGHQRTANQYGDVCAVDPVGLPLLELCNIEIKRGYRNATLADMFDQGPKQAQCKHPQAWEQWVVQARETAKAANVMYWWVIHRRNGRQAMIYLPGLLYSELRAEGTLQGVVPWVSASVLLRDCQRVWVFATMLEVFLANVHPGHIRKVLANHGR